MQNEFEPQNEFARNEGKRFIFDEWLNEVPPDLKMGGQLEPRFKEAVRQYLITTQNFDPYEMSIEEEEAVPSTEDLESWWS